MSAKCYYEVLGVNRTASNEELKAAYQQQALLLHPDKAGVNSQDGFQLLQQAWQVLRDPGSRAVYDHQLSQAELKATVTLHDEIDLEDMDEEVQEDEQQEEEEEAEAEEDGQRQHPVTHESQPNDSQVQQQQQQCQGPAAVAGCVRSYPCRCGDSYLLRPADMHLAAQQIILPCRSCSNAILVRLP
ncbi:hypothetical protein OEZ85_010565 [Tetradesmus obliquus]|uniref:J domain-containing protein n=1 Tax=Tetradesmus obliquus TaxID=3088 RepID=A0ABY8TPT4_TETOB|nr:hypothetical protein OEZ85_010565 [Tetradesmus obliquus]